MYQIRLIFSQTRNFLKLLPRSNQETSELQILFPRVCNPKDILYNKR